MNKYKIMTVVLSVMMIISCGICLLAPATARTVNTQTWTGTILPPEETEAEIQSDLLTTEGTRVILKDQAEQRQISIVLTATDDLSGVLSVTNNDTDWISVLQSQSNITLLKNVPSTVTLTIDRINYISQTEAETETEETTAAEAEEAASNEEEQAEEIPDAGNSGAAEASGGPDTPDLLTFDVEFTSEDKSLSAHFIIETSDYDIMPQDEYSDLPNGVIEYCSKWYGKDIPVIIDIDGAALLRYKESEGSPGEFPAHTKYTDSSGTTVLYDEGYIVLNNADVISLDFSNTDITDDFGFYTDASHHMIEVDEFAQFSPSAVVLNGDEAETEFATKYILSDIVPDVYIEYLAKDEEENFAWETSDAVICAEDLNGAAILTRYDAPAGTYKINIEWKYRGHLLYHIESEFYVRNGGWQGGISR